jgi:hypothetical protein
MNKYILITILLSLSLISCSKNVSIDGVNIDTSSWVKVSTEDWTIEATEDWAKISTEDWTLEMDGNGATATSWENSASIWNDWVSVTDWESTMDATSTWMQLNWAEWNINMDANWMTSDIEWVWKMSITNTWTKVWDIDLSKWTDNLIETSLNSEMWNILEDSANEAESME